MLYLVPPEIAPSLAAGCEDDFDCPDFNACENRKCINPCAFDDPCAPNANCQVFNHQVVCSCPDGYIGTPEISCDLRKFYIRLVRQSLLP